MSFFRPRSFHKKKAWKKVIMMAFPFNPHKWGEVDSLTVRLPQLDATILLYLHGDLGHPDPEGAQPVNSLFMDRIAQNVPAVQN